MSFNSLKASGVDVSPDLKALKPGVPEAEDPHPISTVRQSELNLPLLFCSIQALNRLDDAHPLLSSIYQFWC